VQVSARLSLSNLLQRLSILVWKKVTCWHIEKRYGRFEEGRAAEQLDRMWSYRFRCFVLIRRLRWMPLWRRH